MRATEQDGSYPRPMVCREAWLDLDGEWDFAYDDDDRGVAQRWFATGPTSGAHPGEHFDRRITVPYPPESPASGIGERGFHPVVWYRRRIPHDLLTAAAPAGRRVLLHFGAVDFAAQVWLDGQLVSTHVGGQSPFTADLTDALQHGATEHVVVVRAEDDPHDVEKPRGKQDWRERPHGIWYERTTGIWQSVWAEVVAAHHVVEVAWTSDPVAATVHGEIVLSRRVPGAVLDVTVRCGEQTLGHGVFDASSVSAELDVAVPALRNGQERAQLLWTPEHPVLLDIAVVLRAAAGGPVIDEVASYTGVRTATVGGGSFQLNSHPYYLRSVLDQGYRPATHLACADSAELHHEVARIKALGFNAVRIHQKAEDPRFLYWADRLGLLVWSETAGAYAFSARAVTLLVTEWLALVRRYRSHPSVVTWVPINESWGVQDMARSAAQRSYARALAELTRALDPTRPVMSNEGWEHVDSDIVGVHDYTSDPEELRERYAGPDAIAAFRTARYGPAGRELLLSDGQRQALASGEAPLMITEFGGISMSDDGDTWGYAVARSDTEYATVLGSLFDALRAAPGVSGFCYTQFMDTGQETNGLLFADGTPKLPVDTLRQIVTGVKAGEGEQAGSPAWP